MYDSTSKPVYSSISTSIVIAGSTFAITSPTTGTFVAGQGVTIQWTAANVDVTGPSKISLGYDPDSTAFDANESWIEVDQVTAANGTASYTWNTTGVAGGTYYLSGYVYDSSTSKPVYSSISTSIVIAGSTFAITSPTTGTFVAGQGVTIQWTAANVDVTGPSKISLGYDPDSTAFDANESWIEVDQVTAANGTGSYVWNTAGISTGVYYLSGYMEDSSTGKAIHSHVSTAIAILDYNFPPFTLTGPGSGTFAAGQTLTIQWTATNVDTAGPVKSAWATTRTLRPSTPTSIDRGQRVTAANGAGSYGWNTTGIAAGTYYLSGYMYDFSTGKAAYSSLDTPIVIAATDPRHRSPAPRRGHSSPGRVLRFNGRRPTPTWRGPTKITLGYDADNTAFDANQHWIEINGVIAANGAASYSWNTTGMRRGTYYLSGYMYDFSTGMAVYSHLGTPIAIEHSRSARLHAHRPERGNIHAGQSVTIQWTAANVDVAGPSKISLGYDPDATAFDANQSLDRGRRGCCGQRHGVVQLEHHRRGFGNLLPQRLHV